MAVKESILSDNQNATAAESSTFSFANISLLPKGLFAGGKASAKKSENAADKQANRTDLNIDEQTSFPEKDTEPAKIHPGFQRFERVVQLFKEYFTSTISTKNPNIPSEIIDTETSTRIREELRVELRLFSLDLISEQVMTQEIMLGFLDRSRKSGLTHDEMLEIYDVLRERLRLKYWQFGSEEFRRAWVDLSAVKKTKRNGIEWLDFSRRRRCVSQRLSQD